MMVEQPSELHDLPEVQRLLETGVERGSLTIHSSLASHPGIRRRRAEFFGRVLPHALSSPAAE